ncbi:MULTISPECIES: amino acid ABC transporter permease [unclassified Rhizobium]|uniref:amino acid ABC transporter permease n=1 Tax=unclassified Rhizobium TaxID=2613769 RepID=UPI0016136DFF|nr:MULTISPECIES: amino acid ABC transporter permease [unclassified Rhizobium]MBB3287978.1 polar amino acid transport system permease protein [Rhizobium sp. BK252]MBB3402418.1 polar amino acid transport system permease protein [Rhizobium sp. BK289]MBB3414994.1 polar amino acid transport system permease protein [Rhizobium sp. BK284]MBB3482883.1 polar amino acid transport system permease protein [Rhizobium sp. BK347]MDK4720511.1 amino acid ABC transporter permease [Rhizobium sp. CNPSo 3968]
MSFVDTFFNSDVMISAFPQLVRGLWMTIALGVVSILIGVAGGLVISLIRLYAPKPLQLLMIAYIDIMRAMPMLVVLILIYYALPFIGISFSAWWSAILGFSIVLAAYSAEVFRSGIESVPRGQFEAAAALGIPFLITLYKVVLPQAVRIVIPPTTSNCVSMFKDTSLASTVALPELLKEGQNAQGLYANPSPLIMAALIYIILLWPMVRLVSVLEKKFKNERAR